MYISQYGVLGVTRREHWNKDASGLMKNRVIFCMEQCNYDVLTLVVNLSKHKFTRNSGFRTWTIHSFKQIIKTIMYNKLIKYTHYKEVTVMTGCCSEHRHLPSYSKSQGQMYMVYEWQSLLYNSFTMLSSSFCNTLHDRLRELEQSQNSSLSGKSPEVDSALFAGPFQAQNRSGSPQAQLQLSGWNNSQTNWKFLQMQ